MTSKNIKTHIQIGNLYELIEKWEMDQKYETIHPGNIVLLLDIKEIDEIGCSISVLFDGKILKRCYLNTPAINRLKLII